jgi:hypothetical protein
MFTLFKPTDPILVEAQHCARGLRSQGTTVIAADSAVLDVCKYPWAKSLIDPGGPTMGLINATAERGHLVGERPKNYLMPYPQSEWTLHINYSTPEAVVRPHYDTPDYVCVILLEDFDAGGELHTEDIVVALARAGQAVIVNGSKIKHWVEKPLSGLRTSMVLSLVDHRRNVVVDHLGPPTITGVREWIHWHRNYHTMSDTSILDELMSKI